MKKSFCKLLLHTLILLILFPFPLLLHATLKPGDIAVIGFNASQPAPVKDFTLVTLAAIAKGEVIYITDRGWSVQGIFVPVGEKEGTLEWTVENKMPAGTVIRITISPGPQAGASVIPASAGSIRVAEGWTSQAAGSPWGKDGDQVIIYQGNAIGPHFIYAFSTSNDKADAATSGNIRGWQQSVTTQANSSLLPPGLQNANGNNPATAHSLCLSPLSGMHNQVYRGTRTGTKTKLLEAIGNSMNWEGNNFQPYDLRPGGSIFEDAHPFRVSATTFPVHLLTFTGSKTNNGHLLKWELAYEETYSTYLIEKSGNGRDFAPVASLAATGGRYQYTVPNFNGGQQYYRLKLLDVDSNFAYSRTILLLGDRQKVKLQAFPNPVTDFVHISCADPILEVQVYSFTGRMLFSKKISQLYIASVSLAGLLPGNYFIQVTTTKDKLAKGVVRK